MLVMLLDIGNNTCVPVDNIESISDRNSESIRKIIKDAKECGKCIDATKRAAVKTVIISTNKFVFLSAITLGVINKRYNALKEEKK